MPNLLHFRIHTFYDYGQEYKGKDKKEIIHKFIPTLNFQQLRDKENKRKIRRRKRISSKI